MAYAAMCMGMCWRDSTASLRGLVAVLLCRPELTIGRLFDHLARTINIHRDVEALR